MPIGSCFFIMCTHGIATCTNKSTKSVIDDLTGLYEKKIGCDFKISIQGQDFPCHKSILMARSSVFAAMLSHDTKEAQQAKVKVNDSNDKAIKQMLHFIYTGTTL